jgi:hypothetical protein
MEVIIQEKVVRVLLLDWMVLPESDEDKGQSLADEWTSGGIGHHVVTDLVKGLFGSHLGTSGVADGLHRGTRGLSWGRGSRGRLDLVGALEERHGWLECECLVLYV